MKDCETFYSLRKTLTASYLTNGRAYAHVTQKGYGQAVALRSLEYANVKPIRLRNGKLRYVERFANGVERTYKPTEILDFAQVRDPDGLGHYNPIKVHQNRLNQIMAVENYVAKTFSKGGVPPLQLLSEIPYQNAQNQRLATEKMAQAVMTAANGQFVAPPANHKLHPIGLDPQSLQLIDVRKFNLVEIARIFNIPPQFLQDLSFGTYSNTEQQSQNLVKFLLQPMAMNFERELTLKLQEADEYVKFNFGALLRGDFTSQINGLSKAVYSGIMTPNEARSLLEYQTVEGGDELFMQGANQTIQNLIEGNNNEKN